MSSNELHGPPSEGEEFASVRFAGGRFDRHVIPFDMLPDLAAYREVLIELAKTIYRRDHRDKVRLPRGFAASFHLALAGITPGRSAVAHAVQLPEVGQQAPLRFAALDSYFAKARDEFVDIVAAANEGQYDQLPGLLEKINRFGRHLRDDEFIELRSLSTAKVVAYSSATRRNILSHGPTSYEVPISGYYELNGVKASPPTVHLLVDGREVDAVEVPEEYIAGISEKNATSGQVFISGIGHYAKDELQKISSVEEVLLYDDAMVRESLNAVWTRVGELKLLDAGWLDGSGKPINNKAADKFLDLISIVVKDSDSRSPLVFPSEDGGVRAEWRKGNWEVSLEVSGSEEESTGFYVHALDVDSHEFKELDSSSEDALQDFLDELRYKADKEVGNDGK